MSLASTAPHPEQQAVRPRLLHAFPHHADVALCGRRRKPAVFSTEAGSRCPVCETLATEKWFLGR